MISLRSLLIAGGFAISIPMLPDCALIAALEAKPPLRVRVGTLDLGDGRSQGLHASPRGARKGG